MIDAAHQKVNFLHPVGMSTLKYGVTIPIEAQTERMNRIGKGEKVLVTVLFGSGEPAVVEIRRLNNKVGHLQFRYEKKAQEGLRQFLSRTFSGHDGDLLAVEEVSPLVFLFKPILKKTVPRLQVSDLQLHRMEPSAMKTFIEVDQIREVVASVEYEAGFNQVDYNGLISKGLLTKGWNSEQRVVKELGLKCDFEKNGIWVEVEFGNARAYYQDYVKFMLAKKYRDARLGLLLCPTTSFANLLCELGRQRAETNIVRERPAVYSGMMSYEKAVRELPYLGFMFEMPILVAGVGVVG